MILEHGIWMCQEGGDKLREMDEIEELERKDQHGSNQQRKKRGKKK